MKKDTKTFLYTVLGIPLVLSWVWGLNAANEASTVTYQREHVAEAVPEIVLPVEPAQEVVAVATATPVVPVPKPVRAKPVPQPVVVPVPVAPPAVVTVVTPPPADPAPKPKPVAVKKARRTRAS
ncbi:MAG: hypothetical protein AB199_01515 [Parcubacteria bacterium C7867-004]|nr:MAG: hypothetical protein AB199_01515 [Parcubacteria bacterium C7867-004]